MDSREIKTLERISYAEKCLTQLESISKIESYKRPQNIVVNSNFKKEYGLEITDIVPHIIELFYRKGKEDALKELKESL